MKKKIFLYIFLLLCNIYCFCQKDTDKRYQVYEETLIRLIDYMDSIFSDKDTISYFFEKVNGITDSFPQFVKNHKIIVLDLKEIDSIIQSHFLILWTIFPIIIEKGQFRVRIFNEQVSKFGNSQGMSRLGMGILDCIFLYDYEQERFVFEKWL